MSPRHTEHSQKRQLRAPTDDRKRLGRENQQAAGEKRHQRKNVQVDTIGAGQSLAGLDAGLGTLDRKTRGQLLLKPFAKSLDIDPGL